MTNNSIKRKNVKQNSSERKKKKKKVSSKSNKKGSDRQSKEKQVMNIFEAHVVNQITSPSLRKFVKFDGKDKNVVMERKEENRTTEIMDICNVFKLLTITNKSEKFKASLERHLNKKNTWFFYETMKTCSYKYTKSFVFDIINKRFCGITIEKQHCSFSLESIKEILLSSSLKISTEVETFSAIESWIGHDSSERLKYAKELINLVRLQLLTHAALKFLLARKSDFAQNESIQTCLSKIIETKNNNHVSNTTSDVQNRHFKEDRLYIIARDTKHGNQYNIYMNKKKVDKKEIGFVEIKDDIAAEDIAVLAADEKLYFLCPQDLMSYNINTKKIKKVLATYPVARAGGGYCIFMGHIIILRGVNLNHQEYDRDAMKNYSYNIKNVGLAEISRLPEDKEYYACAVFDGRIVVSGGGDGKNYVKSVHVYDFFQEVWSEMPEMNEVREMHASIAVHNKLYIVGGSSPEFEVFDLCSEKFVYIKTPSLSTYAWDGLPVRCFKLGNKIKIFIASKSHQDTLDVFVFDVQREEEWIQEVVKVERAKESKFFLC